MKSKTVAAFTALFLGGIGIHHFYLGNTIRGVFYLLFCWTFIPMFISFFEALFLFLKDEKDFDLKYNPSKSQSLDKLNQLEKLHELKQKGILSDQEFNEQRSKLL